jgi:hypothetical protein
MNCRWYRPTPAGEYPKTAECLGTYQQYFEQIEGINELADAWNRPVRFSISNGLLTCRSAGPEGGAERRIRANRLATGPSILLFNVY